LELAIIRNATHGLQLSTEDKRAMAQRIYNTTPERERADKKRELAKILSVPERTIRYWLSDIDRTSKEQRDQRIFDLWLACYTQEEIAEAVGLTQAKVSQTLDTFISFGNLAKTYKLAASHLVDFEPPLYNIWSQVKKTPGVAHFGNSEVRWVDNLLYLYTEPFDVVVDPFAGSGSTIDICRKRLRRYWASDRKPIVERETEIRQWDVTQGLPPLPRWQDVKLVYLDPPYWQQAAGKYSNDETDLANMELQQFTDTLASLITQFGRKLSSGAYIALMMQPTQWSAPDRAFTDHVGDMLRLVKLPVDMRFSVPYATEQYLPQQVEWAKEHKRCLVLTREIVVWRAA
jgi:hypothetical protein